MPTETGATLYHTDFAAWAETQAAALARREAGQLDWKALAHEIGELGRRDEHAIRSNLLVVLKLMIQHELRPETRCALQNAAILRARFQIRNLIEESPSLATYPARIHESTLAEAYDLALIELGIDTERPPAARWTIEQALDPDFRAE